MTDEQREFLKKRIRSLKTKQRNASSVMQKVGIQATINGMKEQLKTDIWNPPFPERIE